MINTTDANIETTSKSHISNPIEHSRFTYIKKAINNLFLKELNSADSIFIKISPEIIEKIAIFLSGMAFRPIAIGICGETACGKSTIVLDSISTINDSLSEMLSCCPVTRINTDDYYYDRSKEVIAAGSFDEFVKNYDLDVPEAIELSLMKEHVQMLLHKQEVFLPKYDMSGTAKRFDAHTHAKPSPVIIAEGIYSLRDEISEVFDIKIYVDIDKNIQKERFFHRAKQRGLGESAEKIYTNASQKAQIYVHPCAQNADIILDGNISREKYQKFIASLLEISKAQYRNFAV